MSLARHTDAAAAELRDVLDALPTGERSAEATEAMRPARAFGGRLTVRPPNASDALRANDFGTVRGRTCGGHTSDPRRGEP